MYTITIKIRIAVQAKFGERTILKMQIFSVTISIFFLSTTKSFDLQRHLEHRLRTRIGESIFPQLVAAGYVNPLYNRRSTPLIFWTRTFVW